MVQSKIKDHNKMQDLLKKMGLWEIFTVIDSKHGCTFPWETLVLSSKVLYTHPWNDSPEQRAVRISLAKCAETLETHEDYCSTGWSHLLQAVS